MNAIYQTLLFIFLLASMTFAQELAQTVRGTVSDVDSKLPLAGATVTLDNSDSAKSVLTGLNGSFRFGRIPVGRIKLNVSFPNYIPKTIPDIVVNSGQEVVLDITMQESVKELDKMVVIANRRKGEPGNTMAIVSARSISPEETNRYAGGYDDPSRILTNFAGVKSTANGNNDIIVRGNAPKYIQWRVDGVEITNPVHQAEQNSSVAGFSVLNNKLLASSDFYTGAFSPEYGDVLSGIYDIKLRAGNNEKFEAMAGVGIMGTDVTLEGPFKKGYAGSYLVNYRYSTIGLLQKIGLVNIPGVTCTFQDAAFKVVLPTNNFGTFSLFGLGGLDSLMVKNNTPEIYPTPGNNYMVPSITQDFVQGNFLANVGMNHTLTINSNSYIKTTLSYSGKGMNEDVYESTIMKTADSLGGIISDTLGRKLNFNSGIKSSAFTGIVAYNIKINSQNKIQIGAEYTLINEKNNQSRLAGDSTTNRFSLLAYDGNIGTLQNYISWKCNFNDNLAMVSGLHNMNVLLNSKRTLEPRIALNWKPDNSSSVNAGYGKHSTMETLHNYYAKVEQPDGSVTEPNSNLDLLKADHYVLGYERSLTENIRAKVEVYYQNLYNLPVENNSSYYATINEGADYRYVSLVNKGTGKNYGIEVTVERSFNNHYYYLINSSVYNSKYKSLEGVERNTGFNNNYLVNLLCGKEFDKLGRKRNQTVTPSAKLFVSGGQRYIPLLRDANGNLAVDPANNNYWDYSKAYNNKFDDIYNLELSVSYKINCPKITHEIFLNIGNATNSQTKLREYYDESKPNKIGYITQGTLLPTVAYRAYF